MRGKRVLAGAMGCLLGGCAEVGAPPGGPVDDVAPVVLASIPAADEVNVDPRTVIVAHWSERLDPRSVENGFRLVPRNGEPDVVVRGGTVEVRFDTPLDADRTYSATFGIQVRDEHRVPLERPVSWSFSTGEALHRGRITGRVHRSLTDGRGAANVQVALLPVDSEEASGTQLHRYRPTHVVDTDDEGAWTFWGLGEGEAWRPVAFDDGNRNGRVEPGKESTHSHWRTVAASLLDTIPSVGLVLGQADERLPSVIGARALHSGLVEVEFSEHVEPAGMIEVLFEPELDIGGVFLGGDRLLIETGPQGDGEFSVTIEGVADHAGQGLDGRVAEFRGSNIDDTVGPRVVATSMDSTAGVAFGEVVIWLDEPVGEIAFEAGIDELISFEPTDSLALQPTIGTVRWLSRLAFAAELDAVPPDGLSGAIVSGPKMQDVVGNASDFRIGCRIPSAGARLAGRVTWVDGMPSSWRTRIQAAGRRSQTAACDDMGAFVFDDLAPGTYGVSAFQDLDGDGDWSPADCRTGRGGEPISMFHEPVQLVEGAVVDTLQWAGPETGQ